MPAPLSIVARSASMTAVSGSAWMSGWTASGNLRGGEEHAGEDPHRQHDEVHEAGHALDRPRPRREQQPERGERQGREQADAGQDDERAPERHAEGEHREADQQRHLEHQEGEPRQDERRQDTAAGTSASPMSRLSRCFRRASTIANPIPQMPLPMRFMPSRPGTTKST